MTRSQLKKTILFLSYFLIVLFILDKIVYFSLNMISDRVLSGFTAGKLNQYLALKDTTDIIVFGSSRVNHHVDTDLFPGSAFNIGLDGMEIAYYTPLIKLLPVQKKQIVLLHLDALEEDYAGKELRFLMMKYRREPVVRKEMDRLGLSSPLQNFLWSLDYNGVILGIINNYLDPPYDFREYSGFDPEVLNEDQKKVARKTLLEPYSGPCNAKPEPNSIIQERIREIKEFCEENNKHLIIFTAPKYIEDCPEQHQALVDFIIHEEIEYYDFSDFFSQDNSLDYWRDRTHMVKEPAQKFSRGMVETIPALSNLKSIQQLDSSEFKVGAGLP